VIVFRRRDAGGIGRDDCIAYDCATRGVKEYFWKKNEWRDCGNWKFSGKCTAATPVKDD